MKYASARPQPKAFFLNLLRPAVPYFARTQRTRVSLSSPRPFRANLIVAQWFKPIYISEFIDILFRLRTLHQAQSFSFFVRRDSRAHPHPKEDDKHNHEQARRYSTDFFFPKCAIQCYPRTSQNYRKHRCQSFAAVSRKEANGITDKCGSYENKCDSSENHHLLVSMISASIWRNPRSVRNFREVNKSSSSAVFAFL